MPQSNNSNQNAHYVHRLTYSARERLVGFFVLVAGLFLIALIGLNDKTLSYFEKKVEFHAYFPDAKGLSTDTLVKVLGLEVGKVSSLELSDDQRIHATLRIRERYRHFVRTGSRARLNRLGVIGGAVIEVSAGAPTAPELPPGASLPTEESLTLDELLGGLANLANMGNTESTLQVLAELRMTVRNLKEITGRVRSGEGALGTLIYGDEFHGELVRTVALLENVMNTASESIAELPPIVTDVRRSTGRLPGMVNKADKAIVKVNSALDVLGNELEQFPDLLIRLNLMLEETTRVLEAMQRVWPLSSAVRPRDGAREIGVQPVNE